MSTSLLRHATKAELQKLQAFEAQRTEKGAELAKAQARLEAAQAARWRRGETPDGRSAPEIGALAEVTAAKAAAEEAAGAIRAEVVLLLKACADRAAPEYAAAAATVARLHAEIAGAQEVLDAHARGEAVVDRTIWDLLNVPGSEQLPSLRGRGQVVNPTWNTHALAGGEILYVAQAATRAQVTLEKEIREACGGWPFGGTPGVPDSHLPPGAFKAAVVVSGPTRRDVLEKAAAGIEP